MDVSGVDWGRRSRVRQWLSGDAPPSRGAQVFLFVSALLCGAALSGLLFAGIWRHTAGEAARTRAAQLDDHQALVASRQEVTALRTKLRHDQLLLSGVKRASAQASAGLADAQTALTRARKALIHAQAADAATRRSVAARIEGLSGAASTIVRQTASLRSELDALQSYALNPGATGIDPGFVLSQTRYLLASAASASSAAADLTQRVQELQGAASRSG